MVKRSIKQEVLNFNAVFREEKDGGFSVSVPALPGCFSQGDSLEESVKNIREAIELYLEDGKVPAEQENAREFIVPVSVYGR